MKNAIIIGASSGIGRELALQLGAAGCRLGLMSRNAQALDEISRQSASSDVFWRACDITATDKAIESLKELAGQLGQVDSIYIVAGTGFMNKTLDWRAEEETLAVNCLGFAAMAVSAMQLFENQGSGHLVAITSVAAVRASGEAPAYGASKAFASNYLEALRYRNLQNSGKIAITEIRPGFVDTAMMKADKPFWVISAEQAAREILAAVAKRKKLAYVSERWRLVALLMRLLPPSIYARLS